MDKKFLGPLLITILIVGSMLSMVVLNSNQDDNPVDPTQPTPGPTDTPVEVIPVAYTARDIDANVYELSSVFPVYGFTSETNILALENKLNSLQSVDRVLSKQFENPVEGREDFMPVLAELLLKPGVDPEAAELEISTVLSDLEFYRMGVVKLPTEIEAIPEGDSNSVLISFDEPFAGCILGADALLGDELSIILSFYAQDKIPIRESMRGAMEVNKSLVPLEKTIFSDVVIKGVSPIFGFEGEFYYAGFEAESMKQDLESIEYIETVDLDLKKIQLVFSVVAELNGEQDANKLKDDLNAAFLAVEGIDRVLFFESEGIDARIVYSEETGYAFVRDNSIAAAESVLSGLDYQFIDPLAEIGGSINLLKENPDLNFSDIHLEAKQVFDFYSVNAPIWQPAIFDVNELVDSETGMDFNLPTNEFPIKITPGMLPGDSVRVEIVLSLVRGEVTEAKAKLAE